MSVEHVRGSRRHQQYRTSTGELVPGVTTALNVLAKPALVPWANRLGLQGIDVSKYVDGLASIGTCAHLMIAAHLQNRTPDLSDYSRNEIDKAENAFLKFLDWDKKHEIEPILVEGELVSDKYRYGGTIDFFGRIDGELCVMDLKTAKGIYTEHFLQVAAYRALLEEAGHAISSVRILQVGRNEEEGFGERVVVDTRDLFQMFLAALEIYRLKRKIEKGVA